MNYLFRLKPSMKIYVIILGNPSIIMNQIRYSQSYTLCLTWLILLKSCGMSEKIGL